MFAEMARSLTTLLQTFFIAKHKFGIVWSFVLSSFWKTFRYVVIASCQEFRHSSPLFIKFRVWLTFFGYVSAIPRALAIFTDRSHPKALHPMFANAQQKPIWSLAHAVPINNQPSSLVGLCHLQPVKNLKGRKLMLNRKKLTNTQKSTTFSTWRWVAVTSKNSCHIPSRQLYIFILNPASTSRSAWRFSMQCNRRRMCKSLWKAAASRQRLRQLDPHLHEHDLATRACKRFVCRTMSWRSANFRFRSCWAWGCGAWCSSSDSATTSSTLFSSSESENTSGSISFHGGRCQCYCQAQAPWLVIAIIAKTKKLHPADYKINRIRWHGILVVLLQYMSRARLSKSIVRFWMNNSKMTLEPIRR